MSQQFIESFLSLLQEKNYFYNIPKDKELLLYDFYMIVHLNALKKEGRFEPGDKVDPYGQTINALTHSMGVQDSTLHSFEEIKKELLDTLKPDMLEAAFYAVSCEFRHVFDLNNINGIKHRLGSDAALFCKIFQHNFSKLNSQSNGEHYDDPDYINHKNNRRKRFKQKHQVKLSSKEASNRNANYYASYKAVKKQLLIIIKIKTLLNTLMTGGLLISQKNVFSN